MGSRSEPLRYPQTASSFCHSVVTRSLRVNGVDAAWPQDLASSQIQELQETISYHCGFFAQSSRPCRPLRATNVAIVQKSLHQLLCKAHNMCRQRSPLA